MEYEDITVKVPKALEDRIKFLAEQADLTPDQMASAMIVLAFQGLLEVPTNAVAE